ncbi:MAG: XdhC family protein [Candidatus Omnitrophica bacterium]|nr:XdhC family protein [Candidatus Omnitrophota bacterium]
MQQNILLNTLIDLTEKNQSYAVATVISATVGTPGKTGAKMIVQADGTSFGTVGGGMVEKKVQQECIKSIKSRLPELKTYAMKGHGWPVCGGEVAIFIEPFLGQKKLIICGGGHIALPLSMNAKILGFEVTVIDSRKEFANSKRFPHVDKIICGLPDQLSKMTIDSNSHVVIITHNHTQDFACLKQTIKCPTTYIGVIGSQTKINLFLKDLKKIGIKKNDLKKLYLPIGIDIGAQTPEEIAISIMAEIIAVNNQPKIGTEKFQKKENIK